MTQAKHGPSTLATAPRSVLMRQRCKQVLRAKLSNKFSAHLLGCSTPVLAGLCLRPTLHTATPRSIEILYMLRAGCADCEPADLTWLE